MLKMISVIIKLSFLFTYLAFYIDIKKGCPRNGRIYVGIELINEIGMMPPDFW